MIWREALRLFGYQFGVGIVIVIIGVILEQTAGIEIPSGMSGVGTLVASQLFAVRRYQKYRDDLAGRFFALSWRSTLYFTIFLAVAAGVLFYLMPTDETPKEILESFGLPLGVWAAVIVIGLGLQVGLTHGGMKLGINLAKKGEAKKLAKGAS